MSGASRIAGPLSRARQAGRVLQARSLEERIDAVGAVLDAWSDAEGRWQRALVREHSAHCGFSEATVRDGLALALADWTSEALRRLVDAEAGALSRASAGGSAGAALPFSLTSVLLAGSIPMPTMLQLLLPLVVGSPVIAKTAARDPVTAAHLLDSMRVIDPELAACIEVVEPETDEDARLFFSAPCVIASGSDATIGAVRARLDGGQRLIAHPHKLSLAVLGRGAWEPGAADRVALDASLWDQLGCLSPISVYLVGADERSATTFAHELARALVDREAQFPRGEIDDHAAAAVHTEREEARLRIATRGSGVLIESPVAGSGGSGRGASGLAWTVVLEADAEPRTAPLHRFLRIHAVDDAPALGRALAPLGRFLSTVAIDGFEVEEQRRIALRMAELGASRVCRPGHMQTPPLAWHHDGLPPLQPLVRNCDFEF